VIGREDLACLTFVARLGTKVTGRRKLPVAFERVPSATGSVESRLCRRAPLDTSIVSVSLRFVTAYQAGRQLEALGDPTRRAVLERLLDGPLAVVDIARTLPVSRPAVSQHLKVLKDVGLVTDRAEGTRRLYAIDRNGLAAIRKYFDRFWDKALDEFRRVAEESYAERQSKSAAKARKKETKR
jgi:DNA-binding transcriptional ArsR family regulator